ILNQKAEQSPSLAKELAGYIYTEVNRLSALVGRFLDFARPSRLNLRPEGLPEVMEASLKAVTQQGATANVHVLKDYAPDLPKLAIDRELCEQAFTNLLANACEAMGEQGGELRIRILQPGSSGSDNSDSGNSMANDRDKVVVEIEDTGPG